MPGPIRLGSLWEINHRPMRFHLARFFVSE